MNKGIRTVLIILAVLILIAVGVFFVLDKEPANTDIFACTTKTAVEDYLKNNKAEQYAMDDGQCRIQNLEVLDREAKVTVLFNAESASRTSAVWTLSDEIAHEFTQAEKEKIGASFDAIKEKLEKKLGTQLEQYDLLPSFEGVVLEDTEEQFYQGAHIREYSIRDEMGALWLFRYEVCGGIAQVSLTRLFDETGYEGFIPAVDMTKV